MNVEIGSDDCYPTWGQKLYREWEEKCEDYDYLEVELEMLVLPGDYQCVYLITEHCCAEGESVVCREVAERGYVRDRFRMIREVAERYANWRNYWLGIKREEVEVQR